MWKVIICVDGYVLTYGGKVVASTDELCANRALISFAEIVTTLTQQVPA